jgi:hypothetical protein
VTRAKGGLTRWAVLTALSLATGVIFAVSVRGNYLFGYGLGQTPEKRELFAWANVAADVWKAFGLVAASALWRDKRRCLSRKLVKGERCVADQRQIGPYTPDCYDPHHPPTNLGDISGFARIGTA